MALIKCPRCGKEMSDRAVKCPHCSSINAAQQGVPASGALPMEKNIWIHVGMVAVMLAASLIYFSPVLKGKIVSQGDIQSFEAMVKETNDFHEQTGEIGRAHV